MGRPAEDGGGGCGGGTALEAGILAALAGGDMSMKSSGKVEETGGRTEDTPVGFISSCPNGSVLEPNCNKIKIIKH